MKPASEGKVRYALIGAGSIPEPSGELSQEMHKPPVDKPDPVNAPAPRADR